MVIPAAPDAPINLSTCGTQVPYLPRNLAYLTSAAITIVHCDGRFSYMPEASRHWAGHAPEDAMTRSRFNPAHDSSILAG